MIIVNMIGFLAGLCFVEIGLGIDISVKVAIGQGMMVASLFYPIGDILKQTRKS